MEQALKKVLELKQEFNLPALKEEMLQYRPEQWPLIRGILSSDDDIMVTAETGSGKTILFILKALQVIARGQRAVLATVRRPLPDQFKQLALKVSHLQPADILVLTGKTSPQKRIDLYKTQPKLIIATREVLDNDMDQGVFDWDSISLVGVDEVHHAQGRDTYIRFIAQIKEQPVQVLYFSATPAADRKRLLGLLYFLKVNQSLVMANRTEIMQYRVKYVDLDDELAWAGQLMESHIFNCQDLIEDIIEKNSKTAQLQLFDSTATDTIFNSLRQVPSYRQRQELRLRIDCSSLAEKDAAWLNSLWAELGYLCWLHDILLTCGRYAFLQDFAYRYGKLRMYPYEIALHEFERKQIQGPRLFEQRALRRLWNIFTKLARQTPFEPLVEYEYWRQVLDEVGIVINSRQPKGRQEIIRNYYSLVLRQMAWLDKTDHPKLIELVKILEEHPPDLSGQVIIFTGTRQHAAFLAAWLKYKFRHLNRRIVHVYSPSTARQKREFERNLRLFRQNQADILITTDYLREGFDVPRTQVCIEYMTTDTYPIKRVQGRGRVGRDIKHDRAFIYYLITRQSGEFRRMTVAGSRSRAMNRDIRRLGKLVQPEKLEKDLFNIGDQ